MLNRMTGMNTVRWANDTDNYIALLKQPNLLLQEAFNASSEKSVSILENGERINLIFDGISVEVRTYYWESNPVIDHSYDAAYEVTETTDECPLEVGQVIPSEDYHALKEYYDFQAEIDDFDWHECNTPDGSPCGECVEWEDEWNEAFPEDPELPCEHKHTHLVAHLKDRYVMQCDDCTEQHSLYECPVCHKAPNPKVTYQRKPKMNKTYCGFCEQYV